MYIRGDYIHYCKNKKICTQTYIIFHVIFIYIAAFAVRKIKMKRKFRSVEGKEVKHALKPSPQPSLLYEEEQQQPYLYTALDAVNLYSYRRVREKMSM